MYELLLGLTVADTFLWFVSRFWRCGLVLWTVVGHPPLLIRLVAVVIFLNWVRIVFEYARYSWGLRERDSS